MSQALALGRKPRNFCEDTLISTSSVSKSLIYQENKEAFLNYWWDFFMSVWSGLEVQGLIDEAMLAKMKAEYSTFRADPDLVFYASALQAFARKPS